MTEPEEKLKGNDERVQTGRLTSSIRISTHSMNVETSYFTLQYRQHRVTSELPSLLLASSLRHTRAEQDGIVKREFGSTMKRSSSGNNGGSTGGSSRYPSYQSGGMFHQQGGGGAGSSAVATNAAPPSSSGGGLGAPTLFGGYQPPVHYASDQTKTLEDTTKTLYQTDETAGSVLQKMTAQRQQIGSASDNVWEMRQATEAAKREILALQQKYRQKKRNLYALIALLSVTDLLLFFRILQCKGNFFC